ncbi:MAG: hypothetical protein LBK59_09595, partial [Bifidobacteriaceae bacterium]|nr:hypothetical protein [Bifidobacteriaceae bacterium]
MTELPRSPELSLSELPSRLELPALAVNLIAFVALAAALGGAGPVPLTVCATLAIVAAIWLARADLPGLWRRARFADTFTMGRGMVAIAATVALHARSSGSLTLIGPLVLILLIVAGEPVARRLGELAVPYAAGLPGIHTYERPWVSAGTSALVNWLALTVLVVAAVPGGPTSAAGIAAGIAAVVLVACVADSVFRIQARRSFQRRLPAILAAVKPTFVLH